MFTRQCPCIGALWEGRSSWLIKETGASWDVPRHLTEESMSLWTMAVKVAMSDCREVAARPIFLRPENWSRQGLNPRPLGV